MSLIERRERVDAAKERLALAATEAFADVTAFAQDVLDVWVSRYAGARRSTLVRYRNECGLQCFEIRTPKHEWIVNGWRPGHRGRVADVWVLTKSDSNAKSLCASKRQASLECMRFLAEALDLITEPGPYMGASKTRVLFKKSAMQLVKKPIAPTDAR